jgi:aspartate carbamoyltransferase catalytic subunit
MLGPRRSLFSLDDISDKELGPFFKNVTKVKQAFAENKGFSHLQKSTEKNYLAALFFLEPSTRTRLSFEIAAKRLGIQTVLFDNIRSSSVAKGESFADTFFTIQSMKPDLFVVRHPENEELAEALRASHIPIINGGQGAIGHPTQALLDCYTALESFGNLEGKNILFVGDIKYGRAAHSSIELFSRLGSSIGCLSPEGMGYEGKLKTKVFNDIQEASAWADVVMGLRIQKERHTESVSFSAGDYIRRFRLDPDNLSELKDEAIIMHPGPFVPEVDFSSTLLKDKRCMVHRQVENGVYVRAFLLGQILDLWVEGF